MKRLAIFSHFDKHNIIDDYVICYLAELQKVAEDIIFISGCSLSKQELKKLDKICLISTSQQHEGINFINYKIGFNILKKNYPDKFSNIDELIFASDSYYAVNQFEFIFNQMLLRNNVDCWGMTDNYQLGYCIQGYFLVFRQNIFLESFFDKFVQNIFASTFETKKNYEVSLTKLLLLHNKKILAYFSKNYLQAYLNNNEKIIKKELLEIIGNYRYLIKLKKIYKKIFVIKDNYHQTESCFILVKIGCPLLGCKIEKYNLLTCFGKKILNKYTKFKISLINNHSRRINHKILIPESLWIKAYYIGKLLLLKSLNYKAKIKSACHFPTNSHKILLQEKTFNSNILYVFPIIDWGFRFQRPQHLARGFARHNYDVFYFTTSFNIFCEPGYSISNIEERVFEVRLNSYRSVNIYLEEIDVELKKFWMQSIAKLENDFLIIKKTIKLDHPFWIELIKDLNGTIIYDCMDDHSGFETGLTHILELEKQAVKLSDILVASSTELFKKFAPHHKSSILIENACDYDFFSCVTKNNEVEEFKKKLNGRPVIGYFGAIANWFDLETLEYLADKFFEYNFVLIGSTYGCKKIHKLENKMNVYLLKEKPYNILPSYLSLFDICLIPFKILPLTMATNPVKMYEYLSQGKHIISSELPEVVRYSHIIHIAKNKLEFEEKIIEILKQKDSQDLITSRIEVAKNNSWNHRFTQLINFIYTTPTSLPKVSVIILTYNNLNLTQKCLYSLYQYSNYQNLEIIVVDNLSIDGSRQWLANYALDKSNLKLILNDANLGFSAGNNIGIKHSTGEYIIILNNDTFVSPNWIRSLIKYFDNPKVGIVGPVTNNIGNQAKIILPDYSTEHEFISLSILNYYNNFFKTYEMHEGGLAFFCVAISREIINRIGLLDEKFGIGWFEDDDYNLRVRKAGYNTIIADDVLIHHEYSASFNKLADKIKIELFKMNKLYFEQKHNTKWIAHTSAR
jgi:GT2 family glycosyltransferase